MILRSGPVKWPSTTLRIVLWKVLRPPLQSRNWSILPMRSKDNVSDSVIMALLYHVFVLLHLEQWIKFCFVQEAEDLPAWNRQRNLMGTNCCIYYTIFVSFKHCYQSSWREKAKRSKAWNTLSFFNDHRKMTKGLKHWHAFTLWTKVIISSSKMMKLKMLNFSFLNDYWR